MMGSIVDIDPEGDVLLVVYVADEESSTVWTAPSRVGLKRPGVKNEDEAVDEEHQDATSVLMKTTPGSWADEYDEHSHYKIFTFRVCSKILKLVSPVFREALNPRWVHGRQLEKYGRTTLAPISWHCPEAFECLLNALHHRARAVPMQISLEMLTEMARLVECYQCAEAMQTWETIWTSQLIDSLNGVAHSKDAVNWLSIAWSFRNPKLFKSICEHLYLHAQEPVMVGSLPMASGVIDFINIQRQNSIAAIIFELKEFANQLRETAACALPCRAILLGGLMLELDAQNLLANDLSPPFRGFSVKSLLESVAKIRTVTWHNYKDMENQQRIVEHECSLTPGIFSLLSRRDEMAQHLDLNKYEMWEKLRGDFQTV